MAKYDIYAETNIKLRITLEAEKFNKGFLAFLLGDVLENKGFEVGEIKIVNFKKERW